MRTIRFLALLAVLTLATRWASAQSSPPDATPAPAAAPDPARIAEFEKRFAQGKAIENTGQLVEARQIFDGIITDSPEAKGSLLEAGIISMKLNEMEKADGYFSKLHALVPNYTLAIESLIQANQVLKRDVKVERLIREYRDLHASGKVPGFEQSLYFVRERVHLDKGSSIVFSEFFDYTQPPNTIWMGELFDSKGQLQRRLLCNYDPKGTADLRAKDAKYAKAEQFLLIEDVITDGQVTRIDAYFQMLSLPEYSEARNTMLAIFSGGYKPVYSQAVNTESPATTP